MHYLFNNLVTLSDFEVLPSTEEFSIWSTQANQVYQYIKSKLEDANLMSKGYIRKSVLDSINFLNKNFKNITNKNLFLTQHKNISIQEYLKDAYGTYMRIYPYNQDIFTQLLKLEYTLIISKNEIIYKGQFKLIAFYLLFKYFRLFEEDVDPLNWNKTYWIITFNVVNNIVDSILSQNINELLDDKKVKSIKDKLQLKSVLKTAYKNKQNMIAFEPEIKYLGKKPVNAQCIRDLWAGIDENQLTQSQKLELIMKRYDCSLSTATRYMKQFGLWVSREDKKNQESTVNPAYKIHILEQRIERLEELLRKNNIEF